MMYYACDFSQAETENVVIWSRLSHGQIETFLFHLHRIGFYFYLIQVNVCGEHDF